MFRRRFGKSNLLESDFKYVDGEIFSTIKRDINSPGGRIDGDTLKGNYLIARFRKENNSNFDFINFVALSYIELPKNPT